MADNKQLNQDIRGYHNKKREDFGKEEKMMLLWSTKYCCSSFVFLFLSKMSLLEFSTDVTKLTIRWFKNHIFLLNASPRLIFFLPGTVLVLLQKIWIIKSKKQRDKEHKKESRHKVLSKCEPAVTFGVYYMKQYQWEDLYSSCHHYFSRLQYELYSRWTHH